MIHAKFHIHYVSSDNQLLYITINSLEEVEMQKTIGNHWVVSTYVPSRQEIEWRYSVKQEGQIIRTEECQENRKVLFEEASQVNIKDIWNFPRLTTFKSKDPLKIGVIPKAITRVVEDIPSNSGSQTPTYSKPSSPIEEIINIDGTSQIQPLLCPTKKQTLFSLDTSSYKKLRNSLIQNQLLKYEMLDKDLKFDDCFCTATNSSFSENVFNSVQV